jgi:CheY-like chemotaxis protein
VVPPPTLSIAVADDEADTREYLVELLRRLGHQAVAVADGRQLAEQCRASPPDLIISDIRMPGPDGIEAVAEVNRARPVPVILVSAYHDQALLARAAQPYILAYLVKPIKQAELEAAIALALPRFRHAQRLTQEAAQAQKRRQLAFEQGICLVHLSQRRYQVVRINTASAGGVEWIPGEEGGGSHHTRLTGEVIAQGYLVDCLRYIRQNTPALPEELTR